MTVALVSGLGDLFANVAGTSLFQASLDGKLQTLQGGAFPFVILANLLALTVSGIHCSPLLSGNSPGHLPLRCSPQETPSNSDSENERRGLTSAYI